MGAVQYGGGEYQDREAVGDSDNRWQEYHDNSTESATKVGGAGEKYAGNNGSEDLSKWLSTGEKPAHNDNGKKYFQ